MSRTIMLIPTKIGISITNISLGLIRAIERKKNNVRIFKPIVQPLESYSNNNAQHQVANTYKNFNILNDSSIDINYVEFLLSNNQKNVLMEKIIANYYSYIKDTDIILIEGLVPTYKYILFQSLNYEIAKILNAEIIFVISQTFETEKETKECIKLIINSFNGTNNSNIAGFIINKLNMPVDNNGRMCLDFKESTKTKITNIDVTNLKDYISLPIIGVIPQNLELIAPRSIDIANYLNAFIINKGDINIRRIKSVFFCTYSLTYMLDHLHTDSLLVIPVDRYDLLVTACLATINNVRIAAILLTDGYKINTSISNLCKCAFITGLPVFIVKSNICQTALNLQNFNFEISINDIEHIEKIKEYVASYISTDWIESFNSSTRRTKSKLSPLEFIYHLTELARNTKNKRILLPESYEARILKAAVICTKRGIANCVLLGNKNKINSVASSFDVKLSSDIEIIDPDIVRDNYISRLIELRKNKEISEIIAREQLKDSMVLGTLMLEKNEVDGLVSGVVHTTAHTIRPPLQLIKTAPGNSLVSSVFFMLLPEQVYVYGDCAINPNPTTEQLAEIAIQSADSAITFGIDPYVAMISYSTGTSGIGYDVEKVREATILAQKKRPDLIIDGPLQYDTAVMADVAKIKAPNSQVAGRATVFIFPDLNTGNTTYKAVQRSADIISIGPMLQGMRKPVNDLSRGALIDDIVYTIALTVVQANQ